MINFTQVRISFAEEITAENANGICNKRPLPSAPRQQPSLSYHSCVSLRFPGASASQSERWNRFPAGWKFSFPLNSKRPEKASPPGARPRGELQGRGRAWVTGTAGRARPLISGGGLIRAPRGPGGGGGSGIAAAPKWLPASSCREGRCSGPRVGCPPLSGSVRPRPRGPGASAWSRGGGASQTTRIYHYPSRGQGPAPATPSVKSAEGHPPHRPPLRDTCGTASPWQPPLLPLSYYWTSEAQGVPELVTALVNAVLRGLSFLTIVLCATDCFLKLEKPSVCFKRSPHHSWAKHVSEWEFSSRDALQSRVEGTSSPPNLLALTLEPF